jgi:hypothetical protein
VCENCGSEDDDLMPVWPAATDVESAQLWCAGCQERYPNEPADDTGEDIGEDIGEDTAEDTAEDG